MSELAFTIPPALVEAIAQRAAEILAERMSIVQSTGISPFMTVPEAAEFLRCSRQRVYNHFSARRLSRLKEGGRTLVARSELEELVRQETTQRCHARL